VNYYFAVKFNVVADREKAKSHCINLLAWPEILIRGGSQNGKILWRILVMCFGNVKTMTTLK